VSETEELVSRAPVGSRFSGHVKQRAEMVRELGPVVHGEQPAVCADWIQRQARYIRAAGIMQIGHTVNRVRTVDEGGGVVHEVLAVTAYLVSGV
jgi:hypothetical protein